MNKNQINVTIKWQAGGVWPDAAFNIHQQVGHLLNKAIAFFNLNRSESYEVLLDGRSLQEEASLEDAGVRLGHTLLIRSIRRTIDG